jgi:predicted DNA-binding transcriptional regulator YafY
MWPDPDHNSCDHGGVAASTDPTARTLRLLALLGSRPTWSPAELADRLGVSPRTLRRDIERLQRLDYQVRGRPGPGGHYALGAGGRVPPLVFDDDEVMALVAGLRMIEDRLPDDAASRALTKLIQVLPRRMSSIARELRAGSESVRRRPADLDLRALSTLTQAAASDRAVEFDYRDQSGRDSHRSLEALRCVQSRGEWYVVGFDTDRDDWRLFRVDRITNLRVGARVSTTRAGPGDDLATWLLTDFGRVPHRTPRTSDRSDRRVVNEPGRPRT